jgi:hypothetical protein
MRDLTHLEIEANARRAIARLIKENEPPAAARLAVIMESGSSEVESTREGATTLGIPSLKEVLELLAQGCERGTNRIC